MSTPDAVRHPLRERLEQGFLAMLLVSASLLLWWQFPQQTPRTWTQHPVRTVALDGNYYALDAEQLDWLSRFTAAHFAEGGELARAQVEAQIQAHLNSSFARVRERLPLFADWYYSLSGEYSRLAMTALSAAKLADGDFVARRAAEVLFPDPVWRDGLNRLEQDTNALLLSERAASRARWLNQIETLLAEQQVPPPIASLPADAVPLPLDDMLRHLGTLDDTVLMDQRVAISSAAAAGLAGSALWRVAVARNALGSARVVAAGTARGGSRVGSVAAGAAACAPGGPLAVACAVGVGVATWVATDWLLLQADEALNRQDLLNRLESGLQELQTGLQGELMTAYDARIDAMQQESSQQIEESFRLRGD
ncbi:MAG: hypothetical protein KDI28_06480 [Pseudomonadales bacterium]|nr:hypothetical protein [Pseudomonadales bacterium]